MKRFTLNSTLMGTISEIEIENAKFQIRCRSGDIFWIRVGEETQFGLVKNLDGANRDRYPTPPEFSNTPSDRVRKYIKPNHLVVVQGVYQEDGDRRCFNARTVYLLQSQDGDFLFESKNWWLKQISRLADTWLGYIFQDKQTYVIDDFKLYHTNLNITGLPTNDTIQECATLSRLIYGLSSAYLLTGCERFLSAARAGVQYQREIFRCLSSDGKRCFWAFGKQKTDYGYQVISRSQNEDDKDTIPLYEQIYALAGLAQYYRITLDWEVLDDIWRTIRTFNDFFLDRESEYGDNAYGDYFSHLDYVTMTWDSEALGPNQARKNWNSIGDHIPAYLVNLILAIEPLPIHAHSYEDLQTFITICKKILHTTSSIILQKFPDPDPSVPFVHERFFRNWKPDSSWRWQQDRAVIGHNLKIAWNLTRVANYYSYMAGQASGRKEAEEAKQFAARLMKLADKLAISMAEVGVDLFRSGVFDAVERHPAEETFLEFPWNNTKDFWQQEQGILAYLILYGCSSVDRDQKRDYLQLARELEAFWNLFFLDQDNKGIFFRVTDVGDPVIQGSYGHKGGHSISGYHAFELNYLAHIYNSAYVTKQPFCLYFKPGTNCRRRSINVLPDFFKPNTLEVSRISVDGSERSTLDPDNFRIELSEDEFQFGSEAEIVVEFTPVGAKDKSTGTKDK
jgi:mannose/cellobiose epimerase-like protein (N-acyl-D-glucosamine 2-epimerase family)